MRDLTGLVGGLERLGRSRLARRLHDAGTGRDRGAIGVIVAVLLGTGVLLGMGALVIDVGQIYQNRAELQNGADAAAIAVAQSCARGTCATSAATGYANANASGLTGGKAAVTRVCGSITGISGLTGCPAGEGTGGVTDCPAVPALGTAYVDVHTQTLLPNGSSLLPSVFAKALSGGSAGMTTAACARAEFFGPSAADTVTAAISACSWDQYTSQARNFAPPPPYTSYPNPSYDHQINLRSSTSGSSCTTEGVGADAPGNFGWLSDAGQCQFSFGGDGTPGSPGASDSACSDAFHNSYVNKTPIFVPVYTTATGPGNHSIYTIVGVAAFVVTSYDVPAMHPKSVPDLMNPANSCNVNDCISGFFTQDLIPATSGGVGGAPMGADIVRLAG